MSDSSPKRYKIILMILPIGVVLGTIVFMYMYFHNERRDEHEHAVIASHGLRVSDLDDMVMKFTDRVGVRDVETEAGRSGLKSAASMIEGRLGPQNVGFPVKKDGGEARHGLLWKSLWVDIRGQKTPERVIVAAVTFAGSAEVADANATSTLMMLASSMARDKPARTIRFVFLPIGQSSEDQNRWLVQHCLAENEICDGIIGIQTMQSEPDLAGETWQVETHSDTDKDWWKFLQQGALRPEGEAHAVWVTHPVFSSQAWVGQRSRRLDKTILLASQITSWLRLAAE